MKLLPIRLVFYFDFWMRIKVKYVRMRLVELKRKYKYQNILNIISWLGKTTLMPNYWPSRSGLRVMSVVRNREIRNMITSENISWLNNSMKIIQMISLNSDNQLSIALISCKRFLLVDFGELGKRTCNEKKQNANIFYSICFL